MQCVTRFAVTVFALLAVSAASASAQAATDLPKGVTKDMIAEGQKLFTGQGLCNACHGPQGKGVPGLGANLTDKEWLHSDGSYEGIVATILKGVSADKSTGSVMPPKGGSALSDTQVKAAAAYVLSLSHAGK